MAGRAALEVTCLIYIFNTMEAYEQRLNVFAGQLAGAVLQEERPQLALNATNGKENAEQSQAERLMAESEPYAVPLPETLQTEGSWDVYRCAMHRNGCRHTVTIASSSRAARPSMQPPAQTAAPIAAMEQRILSSAFHPRRAGRLAPTRQRV